MQNKVKNKVSSGWVLVTLVREILVDSKNEGTNGSFHMQKTHNWDQTDISSHWVINAPPTVFSFCLS